MFWISFPSTFSPNLFISSIYSDISTSNDINVSDIFSVSIACGILSNIVPISKLCIFESIKCFCILSILGFKYCSIEIFCSINLGISIVLAIVYELSHPNVFKYSITSACTFSSFGILSNTFSLFIKFSKISLAFCNISLSILPSNSKSILFINSLNSISEYSIFCSSSKSAILPLIVGIFWSKLVPSSSTSYVVISSEYISSFFVSR